MRPLLSWLAGFRIAVPLGPEDRAAVQDESGILREGSRYATNPLLVPEGPADRSHRDHLAPHLVDLRGDDPLITEALRLDHALAGPVEPDLVQRAVDDGVLRGTAGSLVERWTSHGLLPWLLAGARTPTLRALVEAGPLDRVEPLLQPDEAALRARALVRSGRPEEGLALLADRDDPESARVRARALLNLGRPELAGDALVFPPEPTLLAEVEHAELSALVATELGIPDAAELLPHDLRGHRGAALHLAMIRARIALRLGRLRAARHTLDAVHRALDAEPAPAVRANAAFTSALVAFYEGRHGQLAAELLRLEDLGFLSSSTVWQHAAAVEALGRSDFDAARSLVDRIAVHNPYGVVNMRAWIALQTGDPAAAERILDGAVEQGPLYREEVRWLRRLARHRQGLPVEPTADAAACATVRIVDLLLDAQLALDAGDSPSAAARIDRAAALVEEHGVGVRLPAIHLARADLAARTGDRDRARVELALAEASLPHPDSPDAAELRLARDRLAGVQGADRRWTPPADGLRVAADGSWFIVGDVGVDLGRKRVQRRLLAALAKARLEGRVLDHAALVEAGWPGERILPDAATNRLHVALNTLRKAGLEGWLVTLPDGWTLDPERPVTLVRRLGRPTAPPEAGGT